MLAVRLLGPVTARSDDVELRLTRPLERALLARLAFSPGEAVQAPSLLDELWSSAPEGGLAPLHTLVYRLRRTLGPAAPSLAKEGGGYVLQVSPDDIDLRRFEELAASARRSNEDGHPEESERLLTSALKLWRGPALADVGDVPFAQSQRTRLEELRMSVWEQRIQADLDCGRHDLVVGELERAVADQPLREGLWAKLVLALYRCGRQGDALGAYQRLRRHLIEELGVDPSPALVALQDAVLLHKPELDWVPPAPPPPGALGAAVGGHSRSTKSRPAHNHNLPTQLNQFIGRAKDLVRIAKLMDSQRLLTLTGLGGCGKTRLAIEAAERLVDSQPDGVWFVDLGPLTDPPSVASAVAGAVGAPSRVGLGMLEALTVFLADKQLIVLLDNCEHLLVSCAELAVQVLSHCPAVKILATSREPLRIPGEIAWPLGPLPFPKSGTAPVSLEELCGWDSGRLLAARMATAAPSRALADSDAPVLSRICSLLEGIPLAIELAAAQACCFGLEDTVDHLDDLDFLACGYRTAPDRQQTLRATLDWSYRLLSPRAQVLFRRLSVFAGDFSLSAAAHVCADEVLGPAQAESSLAELTSKCLVSTDVSQARARYRMLVPVRTYAAEKLVEAGEAHAYKLRHVHWFSAVAQEANSAVEGSDPISGFATFDGDHPNFSAALTTCADMDKEAGLALANSLYPLWSRKRGREGLSWLDRFLDAEGDDALVSSTARQGAVLAWYLGDHQRLQRMLEVALTAGERCHDRSHLGRALITSWQTAAQAGDFLHCRELYAQGVRLLRNIDPRFATYGQLCIAAADVEQGLYRAARLRAESILRSAGSEPNWRNRLHALVELGWMDLEQGYFVAATERFRDCLERARELSETQWQAEGHAGLGAIAAAHGQIQEAAAAFDEAEACYQAAEGFGVVIPPDARGALALLAGDHASALYLLDQALQEERRFGWVHRVAETLNLCGDAAMVASKFRQAVEHYREALELALACPMPLHLATCLEGLAVLATHADQHETAICLLGRAQAIRDQIVAPASPSRQRFLESATRSRSEFSSAVVARLMAQGRHGRIRQLAAAALEAV